MKGGQKTYEGVFRMDNWSRAANRMIQLVRYNTLGSEKMKMQQRIAEKTRIGHWVA